MPHMCVCTHACQTFVRVRAQGVDALLAALGASGAERVPVPSWHYQEEGEPYADGSMPLRDALTKCYDLR